MSSPYKGKPSPAWLGVTKSLVAKHPLFSDATALLAGIDEAWQAVWGTTVGVKGLAVPFRTLEPRAAIVGDFFETLLAFGLAKTGKWRRGNSSEKDLIYLGQGADLDTEIKTSGQASGRIFGNRSYAQPDKDGNLESGTRKKRNGYYLCVNFLGDAIARVRVGWIEANDWEPQKAPTGQMAGLKAYVYEYKLIEIVGQHYLQAPVGALEGIGGGRQDALTGVGLATVGDVVAMFKTIGMKPDDWLALLPKKQAAALPDKVSKAASAIKVAASADYFKTAWGLVS